MASRFHVTYSVHVLEAFSDFDLIFFFCFFKIMYMLYGIRSIDIDRYVYYMHLM
jgi:hypothetical protein